MKGIRYVSAVRVVLGLVELAPDLSKVATVRDLKAGVREGGSEIIGMSGALG